MKWKNIDSGTTTFFITGTITEWQPLLLQPEAREIILKDLEFYRNKYGCLILAYVIMPNHYHLVIQLRHPSDLHGWLHDFQMHTANELAKWLRRTASAAELVVFARHANGQAKLAVWKEQARAVGIISQDVLQTKIEYVHKNPIRWKLVDDPADWPWSSWRSYHMDDDSLLRVDRAEMV